MSHQKETLFVLTREAGLIAFISVLKIMVSPVAQSVLLTMLRIGSIRSDDPNNVRMRSLITSQRILDEMRQNEWLMWILC